MEENVIDFDEQLRRKMGRPARTESIATRFTEGEVKELVEAAESDGATLREWAREVLLKAARRATDDALFTEVVATRTLLNFMLRPLALGEVLTLDEYIRTVNGVSDRKHDTAREVLGQYIRKSRKEQ